MAASVRITTKWRDAEGSEKTLPLYFDPGDVSTVAIAQTVFTGYETLLHAVSGAAIVGAEVCFGLTPALTENPDAGYSVYNGAYLSFENSDNRGDGFYLPAVLQGKIANELLIPSDSDVAALIDVILNGTGGLAPLSTFGSNSLWQIFKIGRQVVRKISR